MMRHALRALALALLLAPAPLPAQEVTAPISTENSARDDAAIANRMREILGELGAYEDVTVIVREGVVTLEGTTTSAGEAEELDALAARVEGVVAVRNGVTETADVGRRLSPALERFRARVDQIVAFLPLFLIAFAIFAAVVALGLAIARMRWPWDRIAPNMFIADIYRQLVRIAFVIFGVVIALDLLNATALLSTVLGAAGIIGLALGFAVRDTVENFIASVMLSMRQPFRPNDTVRIDGEEGKVIRLTSRATILLSYDGNHIRIPNATVFKSKIVNFSQNAERRFLFAIEVDRATDLQAARALAESTIAALPFTLAEPEPQCWIEALNPSGVDLRVAGWIDQSETSIVRAKGEALRQVKLALEGAGVVLPDSTQAVRMVEQTAPARGLDGAPPVAESAAVQDVEARDAAALEKMVRAERTEPEAEDLLHRDAPKE